MAESLQEKLARIKDKAPMPSAREAKAAKWLPIPGLEPGGYIDVRFDRATMKFDGIYDASGNEVEVGNWLSTLDSGEDKAVLRLPWNPGGPVPDTPREVRRSHRNDTRAAKKAAQLEFPNAKQNSLRLVLQAFITEFKADNRGMTDEELAIRLDLERGQVGPRRLNLVDSGWVAKVGERQGKTGATNTVYALTEGAVKKLGLRRS